MRRTELLLEPWQYESLESIADLEGRSVSSIVREALGEYLERREMRCRGRPGDIEGVADGPTDLARRHDHYLYGPGRET